MGGVDATAPRRGGGICMTLINTVLLLQLCYGMVALVVRNADPTFGGPCSPGLVPLEECRDHRPVANGVACVSGGLCTELRICLRDYAYEPPRAKWATRRLADVLEVRRGMFALMRQFWFEPMVLFASLIGCAAAWLCLLSRSPQGGLRALLAGLAGLLVIAAAACWGHAGLGNTISIVALFLIGDMVALALFYWVQMQEAAEALTQVLSALEEVLGALAEVRRVRRALAGAVALEAAWWLYFAFWAAVLSAMTGSLKAVDRLEEVRWDGTHRTCGLRAEPSLAGPAMLMCAGLAGFWALCMLRTLRRALLAPPLAAWYFAQSSGQPTFSWAAGQFGHYALAAACTEAAEFTASRLTSRWNVATSLVFFWQSPLLLMAAAWRGQERHTRFAVLWMAIKGGGYIPAGKSTAALNLAPGFLWPRELLSWTAYLLSIFVLLASWLYFDAAQELPPRPEFVYVWQLPLLTIALLHLLSYPYWALFTVLLVEEPLRQTTAEREANGVMNSLFASLLLAAMANLLLQALFAPVADALDVLLLCRAEELQARQAQPRFQKLYLSLEKQAGKVLPGAQLEPEVLGSAQAA